MTRLRGSLTSQDLKNVSQSGSIPIALDAGTEVNDELADNIPGPCCGDTGRNGVAEDGVILGSSGIAGNVGDLTHKYDWRGYVATVIVERQ